MVIKVFYKTREDGTKLFKTESDRGLMIRKVGTNEVYAVAVDVESASYRYEETNIPVPIRNYEN